MFKIKILILMFTLTIVGCATNSVFESEESVNAHPFQHTGILAL